MSPPDVVLRLDIAKVRAHTKIRRWLSSDDGYVSLLGELADLFLIENLRWFWQQAYRYGLLQNWQLDEHFEPYYNACQEYWCFVDKEKRYMDVLRWKRVRDRISYSDFVLAMIKDYEAVHAKQMSDWEARYEKLATRLEEPND